MVDSQKKIVRKKKNMLRKIIFLDLDDMENGRGNNRNEC